MAAENENTSRLLRQYFPKGTPLSGFSQLELNKVALQGATHNWLTSLQVYTATLANAHQPDTSLH